MNLEQPSKTDSFPTSSEPKTPQCSGMSELPSAASEREKLAAGKTDLSTPLAIHFSLGLAYTIGSAVGSIPPSVDVCLEAFTVPNKAGLTAGARAWSKHFHRSQSAEELTSKGWWGQPSGPVTIINERALALFWKIVNEASWRNLHWLPHRILVYEVRIEEGYGMRWFQDQSPGEQGPEDLGVRPWIFRGFVEPMMENGHEVGWRH
ncbi:uncharacterized protein BT62DRAFT_982798 [Guyanagaster necrorhizus]|uniref:Uncharacterized protein n=1 Tax=Guyanagaster necrorhizus TaxID=856835 RepID=A0A9P7VJA8_9AGAR|nr:uncharacterized protein BT62DRAFT_982798 [Guyanagaster necrorhizus MCA 3950]KAG7441390.1 hypothetical protein BT62DRAFT_982798 [Guyanagaster necrorhizus MCA 3950]